MKNLIFIPGLGADGRLFDFIEIDDCNKQFIRWVKPEKNETLPSYLLKLKQQINLKEPPVLIGVSLGGIIAMELRELIPVEKTIIISSVKTKEEMPDLFNWVRKMRLNEIIPPALIKKSAGIIKPFITDAKNKKSLQLFRAMLHDTDNDFINQSIKFVLEWQRTSYNNENLIHVHGTKDLVFPIRNINNCNYKITGGAHDIIMSRPAEINKILLKEIFNKTSG